MVHNRSRRVAADSGGRSMRLSALLSLIVLAVPLRAAEKPGERSSEKLPTLVVRINSIDNLVSDLRFLAEAAGKGEEGKQLEGLLKTFSGEKGLQGIDTTKPIGLYGR